MDYNQVNQVDKIDKVDKECPPIVCPKTLTQMDIKKEDGEELLRKYMSYYFSKYLEDTKDDWNYITPKQYYEMDKKDTFLLDVRKPEDYNKGHIPGSTNIFWLQLLKPENLKKIPKDKQLIVVCYVGHTASQILVLLKLLGYKVKVMKFGMGISPQKGVPVAGWTDYGYPLTR
jgi:rhodanese-related sulfurtransferase